MSENNGNQSNQNYTVNTSILSMWDKNGYQLRISGNDQGLAIAIWVPLIDPQGYRKYPAESRHSTILSLRNIAALDSIIHDELVPAYMQGKDMVMSIFTNNARTTMLEIGVKDGSFILNLYKNCDATTRIAQQKVTYNFDYVTVIKNYDAATGDIETTPIQTDMAVFAKAIRGYLQMSSGAIAGHGVRVTGQYNNREYMNYLRSIASAVNAQLPATLARGGQSGHSNYNAENPNAAASLPTQPLQEVDSLESMF